MRFLKLTLCALVLCLCVFAGACAKDKCADGHLFEEWQTVKKESCAEDGAKEAICTRCGTTGSEVIPATGQHRLGEYLVEKAATLFEKGERKQYCKRCDQLINSKEIPAIADATNVERDADNVTLDLSDCVLLYDDALDNDTCFASVAAVRDAVARYTGREVALCARSAWEGGSFSCEIWIGGGNVAEVEAARARLQGNGFVLAASANKLVILGSDALHAMHAAQYFADVCVPAAGNATSLGVSASVLAKNATESFLGTEDSFDYAMVFDRDLDNDPAHKHVSSSESDSRDYPCVAAEQLAKTLEEKLSLSEYAIAVHSNQSASTFEILIGPMPNRVEEIAFRSTLAGHEYGILVHDGQVILTAHNDVALKASIAHFQALLELSETTRDGKTVYAIPNGLCIRTSIDNEWITEFPQPTGEGIQLHNTQYNNDNSLQYYYVGDGVNEATYQAYCDRLLSAGYRLLCENSIEGSVFKTFVHDAERITLYVAYNDYKYEDLYVKEDAYFTDFEKCIRVITAPLDSVTLPDAELLTPNPTYTKVADTTITQLPFTGKAVGMGYVIRLEDGRFIVIDGGGVNSGGTEHDRIWQVLNELYKDAYGTEPTESAPIVIAAWIGTHSHWDHYYAFQQMLKKYGKTGLLRMQYMLGNFPDEMSIFAVSGSSLQMGKASTIATMQGYVPDGFRYIKVHTGQKLYFANAELEILMTFEDHNPRRICNSNDTCTIVRFTFANKDATVGTLPTTAIFLADAFRFQSRYLCAMYGTYLRSDIVQLAHHGNIGCEKAVYEAIAATAVFFPHAYSSFSNYTAGKSSTWNFKVDHFVVKEQESVHYVYVAEALCLTLALTPNGPDYEGIYDIVNDKKPIAFDGKTALKR